MDAEIEVDELSPPISVVDACFFDFSSVGGTDGKTCMRHRRGLELYGLQRTATAARSSPAISWKVQVSVFYLFLFIYFCLNFYFFHFFLPFLYIVADFPPPLSCYLFVRNTRCKANA